MLLEREVPKMHGSNSGQANGTSGSPQTTLEQQEYARLFLEPKEETIEDQLQKILQNKGSKRDTNRKKNRFY